MRELSSIEYMPLLPPEHYTAAAQLYEQAFGQKMKVAIVSTAQRLSVLEAAMDGQYAFCAIEHQMLVGLVGIHTSDGSLTGAIGARQLFSSLGLLKALRAIAVFMFYERTLKDGELLMDGISVHKDYRGRGIGSKLLHNTIDYAKNKNFKRIRLDVIDINTNAKRLYERIGFTATKTEKFEFLRGIFGFGAVTTMIYHL